MSLQRLFPVAAFVIASALLLPTVASAGIPTYLADRGHDFLDIFRFRVGVPKQGEGYGLKARVTTLAQVGYVNFDGTYVGLNRRSIGVMREDREEGGLSALYYSETRMDPRQGNSFLLGGTPWAEARERRVVRNRPYWDDGQGDVLGIGGEVATPVGALDLGLYPSELVDFATGIFTIDLFRDDRLSLERRPLVVNQPTQAPVPNPEAATAAKTAELIARRSTIEGYVPAGEEVVEVPGYTAVETSKQIVLDAVPLQPEAESTEAAPLDVEAGEPTTQEQLNAVLENSKPASTAPAVEEVPASAPASAPAANP